jgi:hypothetical protein
LFLEGVKLYGKDWRKMVPLIRTRNLIQIRTHAQKVFKNLGKKKLTDLSSESAENGLDDMLKDNSIPSEENQVLYCSSHTSSSSSSSSSLPILLLLYLLLLLLHNT